MRLDFKLIPFILLTVLFASCEKDKVEIKDPIKILFLGNSITVNRPDPEIGWYGDWGMAASADDKDYVHLLIERLKSDSKLIINFKIQNIAYWERKFNDTSNFKALKDYNADIIIFRLGENVDENYARENNYQLALTSLIDFFETDSTKGIVVTNNFWNNPYKDNVQKVVALTNNYNFVDISSLDREPNNHAYNDFEHGGVAAHPSDFGMENIAKILFNNISDSEWYQKMK